MEKFFNMRLLRKKSAKLVKSLKLIFWTRFWGGKVLIALAAGIMISWIVSIFKIDNPIIFGALVFYFIISSAILDLSNYAEKNIREDKFIKIKGIIFEGCGINILLFTLTFLAGIILFFVGNDTKWLLLIIGAMGAIFFSYIFCDNIPISVSTFVQGQPEQDVSKKNISKQNIPQQA